MAAKPKKQKTNNRGRRVRFIEAPVTITAAEDEGESGSPSFDVVAYTGDKMQLAGWDAPMVVNISGVSFGKSVVANLDHDGSKRVGHVTETSKADGQLTLGGKVSAATDAAREVAESAVNGFVWQASIEASPDELTEVASGKSVKVNGREFEGPLYVAAKSTLRGFAFVSHGADDNTTVKIAAEAAEQKENDMDEKIKAWAESMGLDVDNATPEQIAVIEANYNNRQVPKKPKTPSLADGIEARKAEKARIEAITEYALNACEKQPFQMDAIRDLAQTAIDKKWAVDKFRLELLEAGAPEPHSVFSPSRERSRLSNRMLEAAVCMSGRLANYEKVFDDQTLQAAKDRFPNGISLNQLLLLGAEANGYRSNHSSRVTIEAQRAAFGMVAPRQQIRASGFSTLDIPDVLAATANKFLMEGWMAVEQTAMSIAAIRPVSNFQQVTTVSLTGALEFEKIGGDGEIKHGTLGDITYTNQADTYARMLAITRKDMINDDLGALTAVPRRLGRGGALKLNDIFWTAFLDNSTFFASGNSNVSTDTGALGDVGLSQAYVIFKNQTDPDSKPLGVEPAILLVPTALEATALQLMNSEKRKGDTDEGDANVWRGRFTVETSTYMANSSYTGYSAVAWYLLASPNVLPVIEIAALNGRVEPVVETADADFNVLGVQMRGYSDVGVTKQEYRGGVRADGSAAD